MRFTLKIILIVIIIFSCTQNVWSSEDSSDDEIKDSKIAELVTKEIKERTGIFSYAITFLSAMLGLLISLGFYNQYFLTSKLNRRLKESKRAIQKNKETTDALLKITQAVSHGMLYVLTQDGKTSKSKLDKMRKRLDVLDLFSSDIEKQQKALLSIEDTGEAENLDYLKVIITNKSYDQSILNRAGVLYKKMWKKIILNTN